MAEKINLEDFFEFEKNEPMNRLAYSNEDVAFKVKVIKKMQELGMKIKIDKAGNICATLKHEVAKKVESLDGTENIITNTSKNKNEAIKEILLNLEEANKKGILGGY